METDEATTDRGNSLGAPPQGARATVHCLFQSKANTQN